MFLYLYIFFIDCEFDQRSIRFYANADQKRGCLSLSGNAVNSCHNALLRTFDCGHEKGRRSQAKEGWGNLRTSATRCRRTDETGNKIKEKKKERRKGICRSGSRWIKEVPSCFSTGIYLSRAYMRKVLRTMIFKDAKCIYVSLSFSFSLFRHRSADRFFLIRFNVNLAKSNINDRCVEPTS